MVFPLFHSSFPLTPPNARSTACGEFETAKTTPLTTIGASGGRNTMGGFGFSASET